MNPLLIFVLIAGPMTALLLWVIICELRGVPAFADGPPPQPGELDILGRWILSAVCAALTGISFAFGGLITVLVVASVIAVLATLIAIVWTLGQSARHRLRRSAGTKTEAEAPSTLPPMHRRFGLNFRRTIIQLPVFFLAHG